MSATIIPFRTRKTPEPYCGGDPRFAMLVSLLNQIREEMQKERLLDRRRALEAEGPPRRAVLLDAWRAEGLPMDGLKGWRPG